MENTIITKSVKNVAAAQAEVKRVCKAYAAILDSHLVENDTKYAVSGMEEMKDAIKYGFDYEYWVAVREHGVENGSKTYVKERCQVLGKPVCVIKVSYSKDVKEITVARKARS